MTSRHPWGLACVLVLAADAATAQNAGDAVVRRVLTADRAATGSTLSPAMTVRYAFSGMGLTGTVDAVTDLETGRFLNATSAGPITETDGFDGVHAWTKETSGTVSIQDGGDQRALAVNEAYRRANLWWRPDFGGARIASLGSKPDSSGAAAEVLAVIPAGGKTFEAWFDPASHRLTRTVEVQGTKTVTTLYSDYRAFGGSILPGRLTIDSGDGAKYVQTLAIVSASFMAEPPSATFAPPKITLGDFAIEGGRSETTIPFALINNHIYGEATLNGQGPYRVIFDTGGLNLVTPTLARALGLKTSGAAPGGGAGEGVVEVGFTRIDKVRIGEASLTDQAFAVIPLDSMSDIEGVPEQGLIGYEVFRRFVTRIDYEAKTVTLIDPAKFDPRTAGTPIPFDFDDKNPQVSGAFEGIPARFDIDTGARDELTLNKPFSERNDLRTKHPHGAEMVDGWGIGGPSRAYVTRGASLRLGTVEIKDVVTSLSTQAKGAFAGDSYQGNVGSGVLKRFVVTFDYGHRIMYLKPLPGPVEDVGTFDQAGMWFNVAPGGFKVVDVTKDGPAAMAGVVAGDVITSVDGKPATDLAVYDVRRRLRTAPAGGRISLTLSRAGQVRTVTVTLRDLLR